MSTLPVLDPEKELNIDENEFLELCATHLTKKDLQLISSLQGNAVDDKSVHNRTIDAWMEFSTGLQMELAQQRAELLDVPDKESYKRGHIISPLIRETVHRALSSSSPLESERILDAAKFAFLSELETNHHFDITKLIVFYLKLKILIRRQYFDFELGDEEFKRLLSNIKTSIKSY